MENQRNNTPNKPVTLQLTARKGSDGCIELIADVFGAYTARDRLRSDGFQFVKNCSAGMGTAATLDKNGNRKIASAWRKFLIAVEEKTYATDGVSLNPVPDPMFKISAAEKIALLQTYALETDIFCRSGNAFYPNIAWLNNRTKRAVRFFNEHARICSGDEVAAATALVAEAQSQPVKWPDRLYDFNGVSTPLAYAAS